MNFLLKLLLLVTSTYQMSVGKSGRVIGPANTKNNVLASQQRFIDMFNKIGFSWHVTDFITRQRLVDNTLQESTIDQVLSVNQATVDNIEKKAALGKSDHLCLLVTLAIPCEGKSQSQNHRSQKAQNLSGNGTTLGYVYII